MRKYIHISFPLEALFIMKIVKQKQISLLNNANFLKIRPRMEVLSMYSNIC